jgi:hypothetical protein
MTDKPPLAFLPVTLLAWMDLVLKVGAIWAVGFGIYQYLQAREDIRIAKTLEYTNEFRDANNQPGIAGRNIGNTLWRNLEQIERYEHLAGLLPPLERSELRMNFVSKLIDGTTEQPGLRKDILEIVSFFDAIQICISAGLCDRETAVSYFGGYAIIFWRNFNEYLIDQRVFVPEFATGVEIIAQWSTSSEEAKDK